jgi:hypothetical protein
MKKINPDGRRTPFSVTASKVEKDRIDAAAQAAGLPRATFVRRVVGDYIAFQNRQMNVEREAV